MGTYSGSHHDLEFGAKAAEPTDVVVLGGGSYKIGSSVEFDYSCVGVARTIRNEGGKVAMVNFNPETVSTDYDESDRLYFEELSLERVLDICDLEQPTKGTVISVGGQIPNGLCMDLHNNNIKVLGTSPTDIDSAEDRSKFPRCVMLMGLCSQHGAHFRLLMKSNSLLAKSDIQSLRVHLMCFRVVAWKLSSMSRVLRTISEAPPLFLLTFQLSSLSSTKAALKQILMRSLRMAKFSALP